MKLFTKVLISLGVAALPALCGPIALNTANQWYGFDWTVSPNSSSGITTAYTGTGGTSVVSPGSSPWTFTLVSATTLTIQDLFTPGDSYFITDNSVATALTIIHPGTLIGGVDCGNDPVSCGLDSRFFTGQVTLGAGSHSISIFVNAAPGFTVGRGAFNLAGGEIGPPPPPPSVPEPTTFALMGLGLAGLGWRFRSKRS